MTSGLGALFAHTVQVQKEVEFLDTTSSQYKPVTLLHWVILSLTFVHSASDGESKSIILSVLFEQVLLLDCNGNLSHKSEMQIQTSAMLEDTPKSKAFFPPTSRSATPPPDPYVFISYSKWDT